MLRLKLKTRQDLMFDQLKIEQPQYIAKQGTIQIFKNENYKTK